jgi:hypothetical protein
MQRWRVVPVTASVLCAASLLLAGCSTSTTAAPSTRAATLSTGTTIPPTVARATATTGPACRSGAVEVPWQPAAGVTTACVTVGSTVVLTGGDAMSGGTWPGPPTVSDGHVLALLSTSSNGTTFTATFGASAAGSATVDVPFVQGAEDCTPTPCTPVPGRPLDWDITVVG